MRSMPSTLQQRTEVAVRFSSRFEQLLANNGGRVHRSLVADLEDAVRSGLNRLAELENVDDLKSAGLIECVYLADTHMTLASGELLPAWTLPIDSDLVDEVDLILLMHANELEALNLKEVSHGSVLLMLALAGLGTTTW